MKKHKTKEYYKEKLEKLKEEPLDDFLCTDCGAQFDKRSLYEKHLRSAHPSAARSSAARSASRP